MHVCAGLWAGPVADALDMTPAQRAEHAAHSAIHHERIACQGRIYSQPFSEGGAAAAGKAPWSTLARPVPGGYVVNGRKVFASLAGAADYYGVLCTLDRPGAGERDASSGGAVTMTMRGQRSVSASISRLARVSMP